MKMQQDRDAKLCGSSAIEASFRCSPLDEENTYYAYFTAECSDEGYPACLCAVRNLLWIGTDWNFLGGLEMETMGLF